MSPSNQPDWLLIANTTRARILQQEPGVAIELVASFVHPENIGQGTPTAPDYRRNERARFAHDISQYLEGEARLNHFRSLAIIAPMPLLDQLRGALGRLTAPLLIGTAERDLTNCGVAELGRQVARELALGAHA